MSWLKTRDASCKLQQRLTENRQQQEELEKLKPTTKKIRNKSVSIYESSMSRFCRWAEKSNERTAIESRIKHSCKNLAIVKRFDQAQTNFENCQEKEVRQLEELDQAQATVKGLLVEYQKQLVKVEQLPYQEAQAAMFDLMDESKTNGRGSIAWKPFRRTIVTSIRRRPERFARSRTVRRHLWAVSERFEFLKRLPDGAWGGTLELAANRSLSKMKRLQRERLISWNAIAWDGQLSFRSRRSRLVHPPPESGIDSSQCRISRNCGDLVTYEASFLNRFSKTCLVTAIFDTTEHARRGGS